MSWFVAQNNMDNIQSGNNSYPVHCPNAETLDYLNESPQPLTTYKSSK